MIAFIACCFCTFSLLAQVKMPQPSTTQTIKQDFGMGNIELTYSRPNIKGRKVFGDLVPYGKLWRTGANGATKLFFNDAVEIGGKKIDTGTYVLYAIPNKDSWEIILNKGVTNWGTDGYKESEDVVRFTVTPMKMKPKVETFTMQFADIKAATCALHIMWDKTAVSIPIATNINDRLRAQIEKALTAETVQANTYYNAASFYYDFDKDNNNALVNITKAVEASKDAYWMVLLKARIEKALGDKVSAKASAQKCIDMATGKNADYVTFANELIKSL